MFASEFESEYDSDKVETMDEDDEDDEDDADDAHDANDANDAYNAHCAADVNRHQEKKSKIEFSSALKSRIIKFKLCDGEEFLIHEDVLCAESEKFTKQLRGDFKEARTGVIEDVDEPPEFMSIFFDYLYRDGWMLDDFGVVSSQLVLLARLYCLGERLGADSFQKAVLWKLSRSASSYVYTHTNVPAKDVIELLRVVVTELPTRQGEEPLCSLVYQIAACRMGSLRSESTFKAILKDCPELGSQILLQPPSKSCYPPLSRPKRFKDAVSMITGREGIKLEKVNIRE
ncbi:uncharacterized protein BKA78DRAFT_307579 [Phyllosticta capitalensis]|uniref:BTB domain-containing protein n=1 Tax=Phyllosticta capitalensis TaxID=121624 RepID=A0ABR1Z0X2_9PEZI